MKIVKHLPLFFLSILFALVIPHLYNQALATTIDEYSTPGNSPIGITSGPDSNLWFTESGTGKIGKSATSGTITEYTLTNSSSSPTGITSGTDGNLWFTESYTSKIGKITTGGTITEYSLPNTTSGPGGITSGPDGNLWFTEQDTNEIGNITTG